MVTMESLPMILVLLLLNCVSQSSQSGHFYGGSISFSVENVQATGKTLAHVELVTAWVLGQGPCGPGCSKADVGRSTRTTRENVLTTQVDPLYFGNYSADFPSIDSDDPTASEQNSQTLEKILNDELRATYNETVLAVNEHALWEQELLSFTFELEEHKSHEDINFEGHSWRDLDPVLQGKNLKWHIQARITPQIRSDTGQPNNCPQVLSRPFYRIKLNKKTIIKIPTVDKDGDLVKCALAQYIEGGDLSVVKAPNVRIITELVGECAIEIQALSQAGYHDDVWIGVPLTIRDVNTKTITFGNQVYEKAVFSLCATSVQFTVNVRENLVTPEFVDPTLEDNHEFILFAETTWSIEIYAIAPENTTIDEFVVTGRSMEPYQMSGMYDDPVRGRVKYVKLTWTPGTSDIGRHIACCTAIDNSGVESADGRCFILNVKVETFNHTQTSNASGMSFIDIPSPSDLVHCPVYYTCILPIFVRSVQPVVSIKLDDSNSEGCAMGNVSQVQHTGELVYKADLAFTNSMNGQFSICFQATDSIGNKSETVCITSDIVPIDPCLSSPCRNSGACKAGNTTGSYVCDCQTGFSGKNCETKRTYCQSSPCAHGMCIEHFPSFACVCRDSKTFLENGYEGKLCDTNTDDCSPNPCNGHGICVDGIKSHRCDCFGRFSGTNCDHDKCPTATAGLTVCPIAECDPDPCGGHGICSAGPTCNCGIGYYDSLCGTSIGDISSRVAGVEFVPPSPPDGSKVVCYIRVDTLVDCPFSVFIGTSTGVTPSLKLDMSSQLSQSSTMDSPTETHLVDGIDHMFVATVTLRGVLNDRHKQSVCVTASIPGNSTRLCVELDISPDLTTDSSSREYAQQNATVKFIPPTPLANARFMCYVNETCSLLLFTTYIPSTCSNVLTSSAGVRVMPAQQRSAACVTEALYQFTSDGQQDICFSSAESDSQERCFTVEVYVKGQDPCASSPCQNEAPCFTDGQGGYTCFCKESYSGDHCEKGPCLLNDCDHGGFCWVDNMVSSCVCPVGFKGQNCDIASSNSSRVTHTDGSVILDAVRPVTIYCNRNQPCGGTVVLTRKLGSTESPITAAGYVSPEIVISDIYTVQRNMASDVYELNVEFLPKNLGQYILCVQTLNSESVNQDEFCFNIFVTPGVSSLYGYTDRPQFISPSPPSGSSIECVQDAQCHMMYHVIAGHGHENECVSATLKKTAGMEKIYIFSSCDPCVDGAVTQSNCSIDVSLMAPVSVAATDEVCVELSLKSAGTVGEERCFTITVLDPTTAANAPKGCRDLHCQNEGFCDGRDPAHPKCFCTKGFSGPTCSNATSDASAFGDGNQHQSFIGESGLPTDIHCNVGCDCPVPVDVVGDSISVPPVVGLGYVDPRLTVTKPVMDTKDPASKTTDYTGVVIVHPVQTGSFKMCLQIKDNNGLTEDEFCFTVHASGTCIDNTDKSKPYYLPPTLPPDATATCQKGQPCHIDLHFTNGELFGLTGQCPSIRDTSNLLNEGIHIFPTRHTSTECTADVLYNLQATHILCLKISIPGKQGEERCFTLKVVDSIVNTVDRPCLGITCQHGGVCVSDLNTYTGTCVCTSDFAGSHCSTGVDLTKDLPGVVNASTSTTNAPHFNQNQLLPKTVDCVESTPCQIAVPFTGNSAKPPVAGYLDPGLSTHRPNNGTTILTPDPVHHPDQHILLTTVTGPVGPHKACFQTTTNGTTIGENVDELCLAVDVINQGSTSSPMDPNKPRFSTSMTAGNSSFLCQPNTTCHHTIITDKPPTGTCGQVAECEEGLVGVHVFETKEVNGQCVTDVGYHTSSEQTRTLCVKAGPDGEERQYLVETKNSTEFGSCQKLHCKNGGSCLATTTDGECHCMPGYTGHVCETDIDECLPNPCQNGATCVDGIGNFTCHCQPGYSGNDCSTDIDDCVPNPCQNEATCVDGIGNFTCQCQPGYSGNDCSTDIDECVPNPCNNGATCVDGIGNFTCHCQPGYSGNDCSTDIDECSPNPCNHGATCVDGINGYTCSCEVGYTGQECDTDIDECVPNPCQNGATCVDGIGNFTCHCQPGYSGNDCSKDIDECSPNPCNHGATCVDGINGYTCSCEVGFTGQQCDTDIDDCVPNPCNNGATCVDGIGNFTCHCQPGYSGNDCSTDIDECSPNPCNHGATCVDGINGYTCSCEVGYTGQECDTDIDDCVPTPCQNGATCVDGIDSYTCQCQAGFSGSHCETDIDDCQGVTCDNGGTCLDGRNKYSCKCVIGYVGNNCQTADPNAVDECLPAPCKNGATCIDGMNNYTCHCANGYDGPDCEIDIDDCQPSPCLNGATCIDQVDQYSCSCVLGYTGNNCETDIDDCASSPCPVGATCHDMVSGHSCVQSLDFCSPDPCQNGATCLNGIGQYTCSCVLGYTGTNCETDIDDCASSPCPVGATCHDMVSGHSCVQSLDFCSPDPCQNGATCLNGIGQYTCSCVLGYTGNNCETDIDDCASSPCPVGATCHDMVSGHSCVQSLDFCSPDPCQNGATCLNGIGQYTCSCVLGYTGTNCETDIDDCASSPCPVGATCHDMVSGHSCVQSLDFCSPDPCQNGATCLNGIGQYTCSCVLGYTGTNCETDIDDCASSPCPVGATCHDMVSGHSCVQSLDFCSPDPCQNGATCLNDIGQYTCSCVLGYTGNNCETDIDDCASSPCPVGATCQDMVSGHSCLINIDHCASIPCHNGATCRNDMGTYVCDCPVGFTGLKCQTDIDDCLNTPCIQGTCHDGVNSFTCSCSPGYNGTTCQTDIDECQPNPCLHGATCVDEINGYSCNCQPGYTGVRCDIDVDDCLNTPCIQGTCHDGVNSFTCSCSPGYTGTTCQTDINECQPNPCLHGATCVDEINGYSCNCQPGYTGVRCDIDIDDCLNTPCIQGTCHDGVNSFTCSCSPGYNGTTCQTDIDECQPNPCLHGATCVDEINGYSCNCQPGYTGVRCDIDIDDCLNTPCIQGTCHDGVNSFTCSCSPGYTGTTCQTDINECQPNPCLHGATCVDEINGYSCNCQPGYTGLRCDIDINECSNSPCRNGGTCHDQVNDYSCQCVNGFSGLDCDTNIDDCSPVLCHNGGSCIDGVAKHTCLCPTGWEGGDCQTPSVINECDSSPCANGSTCHDHTNTYSCSCVPGFTGTDCSSEIDECASQPCQNNATCNDDVNAYRCSCAPGFQGDNCEINTNDCLSSPCINGGSCSDGVQSYTCSCPTGYDGINCQTNVDECSPDPCQNSGACADLVGGYTCTCKPGYQGINCETDIDECASNPCLYGGLCSNDENKFTCTCPLGFEGPTCGTPSTVNECNSSPCQHGATCHDLTSTYTCSCSPGFTGNDCQTDIDYCASGPCANGGTCIDGTTSHTCSCRPGFTGTNCAKSSPPPLHNISPNATAISDRGPAFTQLTIPEVIKCPVNKTCTIILPVLGEPGKIPSVQNGHYSAGLIVNKPKAKPSSSPCAPHVCYFEATITVTPTHVGQFKYCVQTTNNQNVNADELCYIIDAYLVISALPPTGFIQPPTMPSNSTLSCPVDTTCQFTIVTKKPCYGNFTTEDERHDIYVSPPTDTGTQCEYKVLVSPTQASSNMSLCFRLQANDRHCTNIHVQDKTDIDGRTGHCSSTHCVHGFCDSKQLTSTCICSPGYQGTTCDTVLPCSIGSIPRSMVCNDPTTCEVEFVVTGGSKPQVTANGPGVSSVITNSANEYLVEITMPTPQQTTTVCFTVQVESCHKDACIDVHKGSVTLPTQDGQLSTNTLSMNCSLTDEHKDCELMMVSSLPYNNGTCPEISVGQGTSMDTTHVFANRLVHGHCVSSVYAEPGPKHGQTEKICLVSDNVDQKCIDVAISETCDTKEASENARQQVSRGYASCYCTVNAERLHIIQKRPVVSNKRLLTAAGFGAGGMTGTLIVGVVIYAAISKLKNKSKPSSDQRKKPTSRPPAKVHPDSNRR